MGIVNGIENTLEHLMRSAFSRGSKARVEPVEIASAVRKNMDSNAMTLTAGRTLAPNNFRIHLSSADYKRASTWGDTLAEELCGIIIQHAHSQRYILAGPARVSFTQDPEVRTGDISILATNDQRPAKRSDAVVQANVAATQPTVINSKALAPANPIPPHIFLEVDGKVFNIRETPVTIGRSTESTITITHSGVSRKHARIDITDAPIIVDLGSTNGTFVNNQRITTPTVLRDGDEIQVGQARIRLMSQPQESAL